MEKELLKAIHAAIDKSNALIDKNNALSAVSRENANALLAAAKEQAKLISQFSDEIKVMCDNKTPKASDKDSNAVNHLNADLENTNSSKRNSTDFTPFRKHNDSHLKIQHKSLDINTNVNCIDFYNGVEGRRIKQNMLYGEYSIANKNMLEKMNQRIGLSSMIITLCGKEKELAQKEYDKTKDECIELQAKADKAWDAYNVAISENKEEEKKASKAAWSNYKKSKTGKQDRQKAQGRIVKMTFNQYNYGKYNNID